MTTKSSPKDFRAVNAKYDQDSINGITEKEYLALFECLRNNPLITSVLDLGGGTGKLTKLLIQQGFDAYLCDIADNMISEAVANGIPQEKARVADLLQCDIKNKYDAVILKSAMHEFSKTNMPKVHSAIYKIVNNGGILIDLDAHQPNQACATWVKKWVNLKDSVAELELLVKNRNIYTVAEIKKSILSNKFRKVSIFHKFNYKLSLNTMCDMYWNNDEKKSSFFFKETERLLTSKPKEISVIRENNDLILVLPAVILIAEK